MRVKCFGEFIKSGILNYQKDLPSIRKDLNIKDRGQWEYNLNEMIFELSYSSIHTEEIKDIYYKLKFDHEITMIPKLKDDIKFELHAYTYNKDFHITHSFDLKILKHDLSSGLKPFNDEVKNYVFDNIEKIEPKSMTIKELVQAYLDHIEASEDAYDLDKIHFNSDFTKIILPLKNHGYSIYFTIKPGNDYHVDDLYDVQKYTKIRLNISIKYYASQYEPNLENNITPLMIQHGKFEKSHSKIELLRILSNPDIFTS